MGLYIPIIFSRKGNLNTSKVGLIMRFVTEVIKCLAHPMVQICMNIPIIGMSRVQ